MDNIDNDKIEKFVKKQNKNAVLHHIAFVVDDLNSTITELQTKGYKLIKPTISEGAKKDMYIAFLQLESTDGILIELIEYVYNLSYNEMPNYEFIRFLLKTLK